MKHSKIGKIDISKLKTPPEKHELEVAHFFSNLGYDIEFIAPSNIPEVHRADFLMQGIEWEVKTPTGTSKNTIQKNIKLAVKQSHYIIFDLRKRNYSERKSLLEIKKQMVLRPYIKKILVLLKNGGIVELPEESKKMFDIQ